MKAVTVVATPIDDHTPLSSAIGSYIQFAVQFPKGLGGAGVVSGLGGVSIEYLDDWATARALNADSVSNTREDRMISLLQCLPMAMSCSKEEGRL